MVNGNKRTNGITIAQWNAGHGHLRNKMSEIGQIMNEFKPKILAVSESCQLHSHDVNDVSIDSYSVVFSKTMENPDLLASRITVYYSNDLTVNVRQDLMNSTFSSIWLEVGKPRQKKILVCMLYRDWKYLNQPDESSNTIESQIVRWSSFLDQWEAAIATGKEICCAGDVNLNFINWMNPNTQLTSHERKLQPLVAALFDRILSHGFVQLVT